MRPLVEELSVATSPEALVQKMQGERGVMLLRSASFDSPHARYSFVVARPSVTVQLLAWKRSGVAPSMDTLGGVLA